MANLKDCIEAAQATGKIDEQLGLDLEHRVEGFERAVNVNGQLSPEAARRAAERAALESSAAEIALRRRQTALQAIALNRTLTTIRSHPDGTAAGLMALLVKDLTGRAGVSNIDNRTTAILAQLHAQFADALSKYRTKKLGFSQDVEGLRNMVRELFGMDSGDPDAKAFARMWSDTAEAARQRFNRAGGAIPKREDWGMPQYHDPLRVGKLSKTQWIERIKPLLNREKMLNELGAPMDDMELELMLQQAYDRIVTDGLVDMMPGRIGGKKLANRRQDHRVLVFRDADAWLAYHDEFGHADIYTTLTDHLHSMAGDIARLEVMGPNPEATFRYLRDVAVKDGLGGTRLDFVDAVWDTVSGRANTGASVRLGDFMQSVRNLLVASKLGSAFLSSVSDIAFLRQTARFNGLPAMKVFSRQLSLMNPKNEADRLLAVKMGLTADAWMTRALAANRFTEVTGANFSARVADFTMRASLLSAWTDAGRKAFGMEFMGFIGEQIGKGFDALPKPLQEAFKRYGITPDDWAKMGATDPLEHQGVRFFSVDNLMRREDLEEGARTALATKLQEMILTETDFAVPTPDARVRAITTAGKRRGTIVGEVSRSLFMFKSFPITVITTHLYRGATQLGLKGKGAYLAQIMIGTTVLGAIAMQAKEMARGKDPRDMTDPKFWAAAFVQGGGAGIYGDFLFSDVNRFGKSLTMTMAGPMADLADDIAHITIGNVQELVQGKDANIGGDLVNFLKSYTPGSSIWYTRLAFERLVADQLQLMADPKASRRFRRMIRKRRRDLKQSYWWQPGDAAPDRAPDIAAAAGE